MADKDLIDIKTKIIQDFIFEVDFATAPPINLL